MEFLRNNPMMKQRRKKLRHFQTEAEKILWERIRNRQVLKLKFFRQFSIGPYILDFYCPALKLAIELDGGQHTESDHRMYDDARSEYLKAQGIEVMRFWNHDVLLHIDSVLNKLMKFYLNQSNPS